MNPADRLGMVTTIDKAGRVVIPKAVREQAGLQAGDALEVSVDGHAVRLSRTAPGPRIDRRGKRLVARPTAARRQRAEINVKDLVTQERDRWP